MPNERIHFRLIVMPCCSYQVCWVNPRLPSHCPECGTRVYQLLRFEKPEQIMVSDDNAWIKYKIK